MAADLTLQADALAGLNARQRDAVLHAGTPLFILAGPGSGKTRVLTHRIAYRIRCAGLAPESIMAITFTNRAAGELRQRVDDLVGERARVRTGTFHWMCNGLLRRYGNRIGHRHEFSLLSPAHARDVLRQVIDNSKLDLNARSVAAAISAVKNGSSVVQEARRLSIPEERLELLAIRYDETLRQGGALDLDDLLSESVRLLRQDEDIRKRCRLSMSELLVDEYQDTNTVQQALLELLVPVDGSLVAVGDEDQAIYSWRQASNGSSTQFLELFPQARVVTLEQTYRSTKLILRTASEMIAHNAERSPKTLRTENPAGERPICYVAQDEKDEAQWVAGEIRRLVETSEYDLSDIGVLYRINAQSRAIEDALVRDGIAYTVLSGRRFYDRPEIRSVVAYLRLSLDGEDDTAAAYLLRQVPGVGPRRLEGLGLSASRREIALADVINHPDLLAGLPSRTREELERLAGRVTRVQQMRSRSLPEVVDVAIAAVTEALAADGLPDSGDSELEDLQELRSVVEDLGHGRTTLRELIDRLTLEGDGPAQPPDGVSLLSLHAAKGLEFSVVFLVGMEDGLLPHRRALESEAAIAEERRLCYVGMTRARRLLYLSYAHSRALAGHMLGGAPSRFLQEAGHANVAIHFSSRSSRSPRLHAVAPGDRVHHTRWRDGTVTAIEGKGRELLVTIAFDAGSSHRMQLCHAPLVRISKEVADGRAG